MVTHLETMAEQVTSLLLSGESLRMRYVINELYQNNKYVYTQVSDQTIFSSSAAGVIKVHQIREDGSLACLFVSDEVKTTEGKILTPRHVRCMAKISEGLLFGDDSRNLKLLDWKKGWWRPRIYYQVMCLQCILSYQ